MPEATEGAVQLAHQLGELKRQDDELKAQRAKVAKELTAVEEALADVMAELDLSSFKVEDLGTIVKSVSTQYAMVKGMQDDLYELIHSDERHKGMLKWWVHHSTLYKWWSEIKDTKDNPEIDQGDFERFAEFFTESTNIKVVLRRG
jgi:seryl-tRNA synthetase